MKIYTKKGDNGGTSLIGGKRTSKTDLRVEAYGTIDEFNSIIGIAISQNQRSKIKNELAKIQEDLFEIGATLACPSFKEIKGLENRVVEFEKLIDELDKELPTINHFILPSGGEIGSLLHFARTVCRRTERRVVGLSEKEPIDKNIIIYLNRLSDLLFIMARFANYQEKQKEIIWKQNN